MPPKSNGPSTRARTSRRRQHRTQLSPYGNRRPPDPVRRQSSRSAKAASDDRRTRATSTSPELPLGTHPARRAQLRTSVVADPTDRLAGQFLRRRAPRRGTRLHDARHHKRSDELERGYVIRQAQRRGREPIDQPEARRIRFSRGVVDSSIPPAINDAKPRPLRQPVRVSGPRKPIADQTNDVLLLVESAVGPKVTGRPPSSAAPICRSAPDRAAPERALRPVEGDRHPAHWKVGIRTCGPSGFLSIRRCCPCRVVWAGRLEPPAAIRATGALAGRSEQKGAGPWR